MTIADVLMQRALDQAELVRCRRDVMNSWLRGAAIAFVFGITCAVADPVAGSFALAGASLLGGLATRRALDVHKLVAEAEAERRRAYTAFYRRASCGR